MKNNMLQGVPAKMFTSGKTTGSKSTMRNNVTQGTSSRPHSLDGKVGNPKVPITISKPKAKGMAVSPMAILAAPQRGGK